MSRVLRAAAIVVFLSGFGLSAANGQTTSCTTVKPAPDWVCVNGGWLPPDHPLAIAAQGPPPPAPPASCATIQPGPDWVCVNGGWVPPDNPLAIAPPVSPPSAPSLLMADGAYVASVRIESRRLPVIIDAMTLLQGSSAWTAGDDQGLKDWMRAYLQWLLDSPAGREAAIRGNNQQTWYDLQVVDLALYTGQPDLAQSTLGGLPTDIDEEFRPSGAQPCELARTRAWTYSIFNLTPFLHMAAIGSRMGVDLWNYRAADGSSLRAGVEYLIPFAMRAKAFPFKQIGGFDPSELQPVLRWAAVGWNDPRYRQLAREIGGGNPRLSLTLP